MNNIIKVRLGDNLAEIEGTLRDGCTVIGPDGTVRGELVRDIHGVWLVAPDGESGELLVGDPEIEARDAALDEFMERVDRELGAPGE